MNKKFFYAGLGLMLSCSVYAQKNPDAVKYSAVVNKDRAYDHLSVLASDEYEGRETGKKGAWMAAEYIKNHFKKIGLVGPVKSNTTDPYFQPIGYSSYQLTKSDLSVGGQAKEAYKDFFINPGSVRMNGVDVKASSVVFAGYGISKDAFNEFKGIDVAGKVVVVFSTGDPSAPAPAAPTTDAQGRRRMPTVVGPTAAKLKYLTDNKAAGVILIDPMVDNIPARQMANLKNPAPMLKTAERMKNMETASALPTVFVGTAIGNQLLAGLGSNVEDMKKKITDSKTPASATINIPVVISAAKKEVPVRAENVLGYLEGSDPVLKNELVVVSSHYDHIGISQDPNAKDKINNGADDDGSGTTGVLLLAEAFANAKKAGKGPKRSILFICVVGEEKGLLGSEWYGDHPIFPLANTITNLNIDMIGRGDDDRTKEGKNNDFVYIIGSNMLSDDLDAIGKKANKDYVNIELDEKYNNRTDPQRFYYRSDHYNFAKHGIPVIFYFNGTHVDYHQPGDEVSKIDFPMLAKRSQLVYFTAWELANGAKRPVVNKNEDGTPKTTK